MSVYFGCTTCRLIRFASASGAEGRASWFIPDKKNLKVGVGLVRRHMNAHRDAMKKLHAGDLQTILTPMSANEQIISHYQPNSAASAGPSP